MPAIDPRELETVSPRTGRRADRPRVRVRLSQPTRLAHDPWRLDGRPCCASCGEPVDETGVDFEVDVVFCQECSTFEYDEDYCDLGGEG